MHISMNVYKLIYLFKYTYVYVHTNVNFSDIYTNLYMKNLICIHIYMCFTL